MVVGSGDGGRHQLSQNIWLDKLTVVHLVHLVLVLVSVGVRQVVGGSGDGGCHQSSQNI